MNESFKLVAVHLSCKGRLVIPVVLRRLLVLKLRDTFVVREEAGRLVLEKQATIKQRLQSRRFAKVPSDRTKNLLLIVSRL